MRDGSRGKYVSCRCLVVGKCGGRERYRAISAARRCRYSFLNRARTHTYTHTEFRGRKSGRRRERKRE